MKSKPEIRVSVATVVEQKGKILFVKEKRSGRFVYNFPAGLA